MRAAALFDIHGNLPALEAVLDQVNQANVDQIVVGGDVVPGPMPRETLQLLLDFKIPVQFIHGNCELAVLAFMDAGESGEPTYWGTTSGNPLPENLRPGYRWTAQQMLPFKELVANWQKTLVLQIDGLGDVLFCHGTPRSETEVFTRLTPEDRLLPLFEELNVSLVVCGHTHMQFDRMIGQTRVVNAGSVGEPFGNPGAYWLLLGPDVDLRHTSYNLAQAAERIRATSYPQAPESAHDILQPPSESEMLDTFTPYELK